MSRDESSTIRVSVAGATGWAGSALAHAIMAATDLTLVSGVSRTHAGKNLGEALGSEGMAVPMFASATEALESKPDVLVEYTKPKVALNNVLIALDAGAHVVIGTSGLTSNDFEHIDTRARERNLGVLACGNFALTAVLMMKFSEMAAQWIRNWEIIDYAHASKVDAPSGTARELASRLSTHGPPNLPVPIEQVLGERTCRGGDLDGTRVHSVRLPGHVIAIESIFGLESEKLTIRHDAGAGAEPYVGGALLAIRRVHTLTGLHRGLDSVMTDQAGR